MTVKERILGVLRGEKVDRVPWAPNLPFWWESQTDEFISQGEIPYLKSIGADPVIRGRLPYAGREWVDLFMFDIHHTYCSMRTEETDGMRIETYETPLGDMKVIHKYSPNAGWGLVEHPIREERDYEKLIAYFDDMTLTPNSSVYEKLIKKWGEDEVVFIPDLSPRLKSSFQDLVEYWVGTEQIAYDVMDYPETIDRVLKAMRRVSRSGAEICANSPADAFLTWEDSSTTNISPSFYRDYIMPEIKEWCDILHRENKLYLQHACGHIKDLLPYFVESEIDAIESISPPTTGNVELWDARQELPENIALIGGIEAVDFEKLTIEELEAYVNRLLDKLKGSRYILANSDSLAPGVSFEKMLRIQNLLK